MDKIVAYASKEMQDWRFKQEYMIVEKPDGIWLYDLKNKTADGRWQALKLVLAKQGSKTPPNHEVKRRQIRK